MFQFIESICFLAGEPQLLKYHQNRIDQTFLRFFSNEQPHDLAALIPSIPYYDKYKCRVVYDAESINVQFTKYHAKSICSFKVIDLAEPLDYEYKYLDRGELDEAYAQRVKQDDIIIINQGKVSDSYYANLVFFDGQQWVTSSTPLLNGVKRQYLLDSGVILAREIRKEDISSFQKVSLINAMLDLEEIVIPTEAVDF